jgi:hypothetical protein
VSEQHNSTRPSQPATSAIHSIPVTNEGQVVGYAELKDDILTVEFNGNLMGQYITEGLMYGLINSLSIGTNPIPAIPHNQTRMEI